MLLQGATTGVGILLLIPMLSLVGIHEQAPLDGKFNQYLELLLNSFSISFDLLSILTLYVIILSTIAFLQYLLMVRISKTQQDIICHYRNLLHRALLCSRWSFILSNKMSDFNQTLTKQIQSLGLAFYLLLSLLSQVIMILAYCILTYILSWKISLSAILLIVFLFLLVKPINQKIYRRSESSLLKFKDVFQIIGEQLGSIKMIKSYSAEAHFSKELSQSGEVLEQQIMSVTVTKAKSKLVYSVASVFFITLFVYGSLTWLKLPLETILLLLFIFSRLLPSTLTALNFHHQLLSEIPSLKDVNESIIRCSEYLDEGVSLVKTSNKPLKFEESIKFENVCYRYPNKTENVVSNLSFEIKINQTTALSGPSGGGKTTTVDLLIGLLRPHKGTIRFDDTELNEEYLSSWRKQVAYVTQEVHLFHKTVRENLNWVKSDISDKDIWSALEYASAKDFVEKLPKGLDTVVGDKGVNISGGERQRLALARALLLKPMLLVLDEATSALDQENERKIKNVLAKLKGSLTIVVIAHSQSTTDGADNVIYLDTAD